MAGAAPPPPSMYRLLQHLCVIDSMVATSKAKAPTQRTWADAVAASKRLVYSALATDGAPSRAALPNGTDLLVILKPFADILQQYSDAGATLLTQVLECLLDADALFHPGPRTGCRRARTPLLVLCPLVWPCPPCERGRPCATVTPPRVPCSCALALMPSPSVRVCACWQRRAVVGERERWCGRRGQRRRALSLPVHRPGC